MPDLIRHPELTGLKVNSGYRIRSGMTVRSLAVLVVRKSTLMGAKNFSKQHAPTRTIHAPFQAHRLGRRMDSACWACR